MMLFWVEFSTHSIIDFLSGTASFRRNMKWALKDICVSITDPTLFKNRFNRKRTMCTGPSRDHDWL